MNDLKRAIHLQIKHWLFTKCWISYTDIYLVKWCVCTNKQAQFSNNLFTFLRLSFIFIFHLEISIQLETTTLEDSDKTINMEKESTSVRTETDRLHTMLITKKKERLSVTTKTEERKKDCTRMTRELKNNLVERNWITCISL